MLDVARNIRVTFTGALAYRISLVPGLDSKYRDDGHGRYRERRRLPFYRRA